MKALPVLASVLAAVALAVGCQSGTTGTPVPSPDSPTEPSFPTSRPPRPTAAPPPPTTTAPAPPQPGAEVLSPQNGYVFIETKSGKTRCQLNEDAVGCEAPFTDPPLQDGVPANGVRVTSDGAVQWVVGNLGDIPVVTLDYRKYRAVGWTIVAGEDGTRFTNDRTGHGMVIAIEGVQTF
jgi:hypothetical protein